MRVYIDTGKFARLCVPIEGWLALQDRNAVVSVNREDVRNFVNPRSKSFVLEGQKFVVIDYDIPRQQFDVMLDSPYARLIALKAALYRLWIGVMYTAIRTLIDRGVIHIEQGSTVIKWGRK